MIRRLLDQLVGFLREPLPHPATGRTAVLAVAGFGFLSAAAWVVALPLGLAAVGTSFLVLEYLSGE